MKPILKVTCGIPASGKSTWAKHNAELTDAIVLSTDQLREELFDVVKNVINKTVTQFISGEKLKKGEY